MQPSLALYLRSLLSLEVEGVSHHPLLGPLHAALHKLVVDALLHIGAGSSTTALTLVEEQRKVGLLHSLLHCRGTQNIK